MKEGNRLLGVPRWSTRNNTPALVDPKFGVRRQALLALDAGLTRGNEVRRLPYRIEHRIIVDGRINAKIMLGIGG